ncbi:DUF2169 domain-containing protein [Candidatus Methylospira mobilis]|uniref:DUF2169 family type VI secretion system accessory protein n=1 Tax=Candidatus Methylospira mobilis TaxID=1808979 RepID=UPI0028EB94B2|nr:DUF2169 domain-containing protein [Candidatus Methylospira mobilis]WNV05182.1 DUF2169 domain-containing protein [Candidatus Methylospira mobilis]
MKTIKELTHVLFLRPVGLRGGLFLSVAVGSFFHLDEPEKIGTEIDMWKLAAETLGKDALVDAASPKPVGEFLAHGQCWAAGGVPISSSEVSIQVGNASKKLYVFGEREWLPAGVESPLKISEPKPFVNMPLGWEQAYGGEGYAMNVLGRGLKPKPPFDYWPLPNVETSHFIRSAEDRPEPACFGMLDFVDPRRYRNLGTYDQAWVEQRWPHYPDDFDQSYFNCAAPDQRLTQGFFAPGDPIRIHHMHPAQSELISRLPLHRHRAFIRQHQGDNLMFVEAPLSIDTVWLWPEHERGLMLARGLFPISDDDGDDVEMLFTVTEAFNAQPRSLDEWQEELNRRLKRQVPFDLSPLVPDLDDTLKSAAADLKALPDKLRKMKSDIDIDAPVTMPEMTPETLRVENLETKAKIDGLLAEPGFGAAEHIAALRKSMQARETAIQALKDADVQKAKMIAEMSKTDTHGSPMDAVREQLEKLRETNPEMHEKAAAEMAGLEAKLGAANDPRQMMLDSVENPLPGGNIPMRPSESLAKTERDLLDQRQQLLDKQAEALSKPGAEGKLDRLMLEQQLESIDSGLQQVRDGLAQIIKANADKDRILDQFIEMTEKMTKDLEF